MTQAIGQPTCNNFFVQGIVAARNGMPYVIIDNGEKRIAQFTIAEARSVALDLFRAASYAEADAIIVKFFREELKAPDAALGAVMELFRDFRYKLDTEKVETSHTDPDTGEQV